MDIMTARQLTKKVLILSISILLGTILTLNFVGLAHAGDVDPRFRGITRQAHDTSCGLAALSTVFRNWLGDSTATEDELNRVWHDLPISSGRDIISDQGIRRLDLQAIAKSRGYHADWKTLNWDTVSSLVLNRPVIVLTRRRATESNHFTVIKAIRHGWVYLADSIDGHVAVERSDFFEDWLTDDDEGIVLEVERSDQMTLRDSPLRVKFDAEWKPMEPHTLLYEALLRRQRSGSEGDLILTFGIASSKEEEFIGQLANGNQLELDTRVMTTRLSAEYGLTADTTLKASIPYQTTIDSITANQDKVSAKSSSAGNISFGIETLLQRELDDGTPGIILEVEADAPVSGKNSSGMNIGIALERSVGRFTWLASADYGRRFGQSSEDSVSDVLSTGLQLSVLIADRASFFMGSDLSLLRSEREVTRVNTVTVGAAFQISPKVMLQPWVMRTVGSTHKAIGLSVSRTFD